MAGTETAHSLILGAFDGSTCRYGRLNIKNNLNVDGSRILPLRACRRCVLCRSGLLAHGTITWDTVIQCYKPTFDPTSLAISMKACALSLSGSETTVGFPFWPSSPTFWCNGISPSRSMEYSVQTSLTRSLDPKIAVSWWQCGQLNSDMFCTKPSKGTFTFLNMLIPFTASLTARVCGVVTMIEPRCSLSTSRAPRYYIETLYAHRQVWFAV